MFDSFKFTPFQGSPATDAGHVGENALLNYGQQTSGPAYQGLYGMLANQGRIDPRLLASYQAQSSRMTQQQQDAIRAQMARAGLSGSGLSAALQASTGAAGANRSANLNYQDAADAYARNQQALGLYNQLVMQPSLGYSNVGLQYGLGQQQAQNQQKQGWLNFAGNLLGGAGKLFGL